VTIEGIEKELRAAGGAHQVQRYDFRNGFEGGIGEGVTTDVEGGSIKSALTPSVEASEKAPTKAATEAMKELTVEAESQGGAATPPSPPKVVAAPASETPTQASAPAPADSPAPAPAPAASASGDAPKVTLLITSMAKGEQWTHVNNVQTWVTAFMGGPEKSKANLEIVDAMDTQLRERRNELFALGVRAKYPQLFVDGKFVGEYEAVEDFNEGGQLKKIVTEPGYFLAM
jgi:glutaredoxin-related protein